MDDNLKLACALKVDPFQTDMTRCIGYSTSQQEWVLTTPARQVGQVTWDVIPRTQLPRQVPPPHDWYRPTPDGWMRTDMFALIASLALLDFSGLIPSYAALETLRERLRHDVDALHFLCCHEDGVAQTWLEAETKQWVRSTGDTWTLAEPGQFPTRPDYGWLLGEDRAWRPANVFTVIEHFADNATLPGS